MDLKRRILVLLCLIATLAAVPEATAQAPKDAGDAKCLKCHARALKKTLEDGEVMQLHIDGADFGASVHRVIGCTGCHRDIAKEKHPSRRPIESRRAFTLEQNRTCGQCHAAKYRDYESSIHASLVAQGDARAPLCSDCHGSHAIQPRAKGEPAKGEPCSACHQATYFAEAESVHGLARFGPGPPGRGEAMRLACFDCHRAHEVSAVAAADFLKDTCFGCHQGAEKAHESWLPNGSMHLTAVSCAVCHSPAAPRRIDLQLYASPAGQPGDQAGAATNDGGLMRELQSLDSPDPEKLKALLHRSASRGNDSGVALRVRMQVADGPAAHRIGPGDRAVRDCESCHRRGSAAFQRVTVSIRRPDGRRQSFEADSEILTSLESLGVLRDFYAPGGTRIGVLDVLLILAMLGGIGIPLGHLALGWYLRRQEKDR